MKVIGYIPAGGSNRLNKRPDERREKTIANWACIHQRVCTFIPRDWNRWSFRLVHDRKSTRSCLVVLFDVVLSYLDS